MLENELDMVFQTFEVYAELCLRIDSMPPTSSVRATRATERRSASSISCAPLLLTFHLRRTDIANIPACVI